MTSTEIANASKIMLGTTEAAKMYIGNTLIYESYSGYYYVDLGLPSGLLWALKDVLAPTPLSSRFSNSIFLWANITPRKNGSGYAWYGDTNTVGRQLALTNTTIPVNSTYDIARHYMEGGWRMPTETECRELVDNCNAVLISIDNRNYIKLTSKINGNYLILYADHTSNGDGKYFYEYRMWSSTYTKFLYIKSDYINVSYNLVNYSVSSTSSVDEYYSIRGVIEPQNVTTERLEQTQIVTPILPTGYTELEYISSTNNGNQYIDLGIKLYDTLNKDYDIAIKFMISSTNALSLATIFNCQDPNNNPWPGTYIRKNNSGSNIIGRYIGGTAKDNTIGQLDLIIELPVQTAPNKNVTNLNNNNSTHQYGAGLFCSFSDTSNTPQRYCNGTLYYFKLFVEGTLVRDLIPCKNSNNVVGMYDVVNNVFYTSPNGNAFVAGPAV